MAREFKDSGIEWIGQIPKEWEVNKIGNLYQVRNEKVSDKDYPPLSVTMNGIVPQLETAAKTNNGDDRKLVCKGDFAINSRSDRRGSCGVSQYNGSVSLINTILKPRGSMNPQYYNWLFHTELFADEFYRWGHGIVDDLWTTRWQEMKNISIVSPSLSEQQKIADYLDKVCGEVDEMVTLQETMIEELKAYKQSVITEAVTQGLNPNVPMHDSGIDWIGEIPEHWKLEPLKYCFGRRSEKNNPVKTEERLSLSIDKGVTLYAEKTTNLDRFKDDFTQYQLAYPNDIVLNCMNMIVGAVGLSNYMGCVSPVYYVIYPVRQDINPLYYSYLLNIPTIRGVYYSLGKGIYAIERGEGRVNTCRLKVAYNDFGRLDIPVPPIEGQKEIALYIQQKCSEIDSLIALKQAKIEELKEYKKSVIYEYVTGKKEVV
ncbi:restriction endonuclease subunit S [Prevotella sp. E13-17]|uniref:restriction endonuclease subunit S n=1 Tax=Prevotella sp. E13-17 TaxID=2913616 RepID=UPI001ED9D138|nr:restriction endonuclease subunit S [Prevotella sp. E13-17]UKK51755.1 restriction endonuclease subunit S [Prevotella sp. E13-17]